MLQTPGGFELTVLVIVVGFVFFAIVAVGIALLGGYVIYNGFFVDDPDVEGSEATDADPEAVAAEAEESDGDVADRNDPDASDDTRE